MNLVIVESPSKTKTIKQYLGPTFNVVATKGHIRDIDNVGVDNLGLDFNNNLKPIYSILPRQLSTIKMLNEEVSKADNIYLATDPDREGEAISWHLNQVLKLDGKYVKRIEFNEITESAIKNAINNPRDIDDKLFYSQETRKIMDRVIGFKLSTLIKRNFGTEEGATISAGRVQSACLKMITDKEKAIEDFIPQGYYEIESDFKNFKAKLIDSNNHKVIQYNNKNEAEDTLSKLGFIYNISNIEISNRYDKAKAPFTTSTLIQSALNKYNLSSKRTMKIAQELYEGLEVNGRHMAFITYMRTDSTRLSDQFIPQLASYIINTFGKDYLGYNHTKNNNENIQDAHEAIRPVSLYNTPKSVESLLSKEQFQVYSLIFDQTVESMMKDALIEVKNVYFMNNGYMFHTSFEKTLFDGYKKNRKPEKVSKFIFQNEINDFITLDNHPQILSKETEGPHRFSEATLIKEMESSGIGRPSTYASTIETLKSRKYVEISKKQIVPTTSGKLISKYLQEKFPEIINIEFTADMEKNLDDIADGKKIEDIVVPSFYDYFMNIFNSRKNDHTLIETGELCPLCSSKMVFRHNKIGRFEACSNYPTCKYIKKPEKEEIPMIECPECHEGHLIQRVSKVGKYKGKKFYGCSNYPTCKFTTSSLSLIKK